MRVSFLCRLPGEIPTQIDRERERERAWLKCLKKRRKRALEKKKKRRNLLMGREGKGDTESGGGSGGVWGEIEEE